MPGSYKPDIPGQKQSQSKYINPNSNKDIILEYFDKP